jgi:hypothetical protein
MLGREKRGKGARNKYFSAERGGSGRERKERGDLISVPLVFEKLLSTMIHIRLVNTIHIICLDYSLKRKEKKRKENKRKEKKRKEKKRKRDT